MTVSHRSEPIAASDVPAATAALRERGLRVSAARRLVLESLFAAEGPVSAEEIADGIGGRLPGSDLASVYRNLERLEEVGLVSHVHLGHGAGLYALTTASDHEYLTCDRCGATLAVDPSVLDAARAAIGETTGWRARFTHFPIAGLCPECDVRTR